MKNYLVIVFVAVWLGSLVGCNSDPSTPGTVAEKGEKEKPATNVKAMVGSELLILELTKELKYLNRDAKNLKVPGNFSRSMFVDTVESNQIDMVKDSKQEFDFTEHWTATTNDDLTSVATDEFQLWPEFFESTHYFEHLKFYFISGSFTDDTRLRFEAKMGFAAIARKDDESWETAKAKLYVDWVRDKDADPASRKSWKIAAVKTKSWHSRRASELMFDECLDEYCDPKLASDLRRSQHFDYMAQLVSTGQLPMAKQYARYFSPGQTIQHPGVCSVDINNDGWDDIYICDEWNENKLLINQAGSGFTEEASSYGLDIDLPATSAIFADLDNDGDQDVFIGRCYDRSVLLINENGTFVDRTEDNVLNEIPKLVTSVAATDFNNDGLIDIYLSTYGYASGNQRFKDWVNDFLTATDRERHSRLLKQQHRFLSAFGPANLLLQNIGNGKFATAAQNEDIDHNHNTFQSVWVDFDQDGDQDLYVSNDYAQDFLYRNDGDSFTDVTFEVGGEAMLGFGMGAGWGDFDADQDFDLYVSNMYSKAGNRILDQIPTIDKRFHLTANGNRLYQQQDGKLECLPGTDEHAAKAGWSWGGKFTDFNNDGLLDIYVGSGYLSSPFEDEHIDDL